MTVRAVNSVLNQTLDRSRIEIIIVDDGSSDDTQELLRAMPIDVYIKLKHSGAIGHCRNIGMQQSSYEYVLFLDSDDWLGPDSIKRILLAGDTYKPDIICFKIAGVNRRPPMSMLTKTAYDVDVIESGVYKTLGPWKAFKRTYLMDKFIEFDDDVKRGEDRLFTVEAFLKGGSISVLADYDYYYLFGRPDGTSITQVPWAPWDRVGIVEKHAAIILRWAPSTAHRTAFSLRLFHTDLIQLVDEMGAQHPATLRAIEILRPLWHMQIPLAIEDLSLRQQLISVLGDPL